MADYSVNKIDKVRQKEGAFVPQPPPQYQAPNSIFDLGGTSTPPPEGAAGFPA